MNVSPARAVAAYLASQGLVSVTPGGAWPVTHSGLPDDRPDERVSCTDAGGVRDGRYMRTGVEIIRPLIQVRVQSLDYAAGWDKLTALQLALAAANGVVVAVDSQPVAVFGFSLTSPPAYMGQSEKNRRLNFAFTGSLPPLK